MVRILLLWILLLLLAALEEALEDSLKALHRIQGLTYS